MTTRRLPRLGLCQTTGKQKYRTREEAAEAAPELVPAKCGRCNRWHATSSAATSGLQEGGAW